VAFYLATRYMEMAGRMRQQDDYYLRPDPGGTAAYIPSSHPSPSGSLQHVIADATAAAPHNERVWLTMLAACGLLFPPPQQQVTRVW
jgi:hypothetical protein